MARLKVVSSSIFPSVCSPVHPPARPSVYPFVILSARPPTSTTRPLSGRQLNRPPLPPTACPLAVRSPSARSAQSVRRPSNLSSGRPWHALLSRPSASPFFRSISSQLTCSYALMAVRSPTSPTTCPLTDPPVRLKRSMTQQHVVNLKGILFSTSVSLRSGRNSIMEFGPGVL